MVGGGDGGLDGPVGLYSALALDLAAAGIATLRVDFRIHRFPGPVEDGVHDVRVAIEWLDAGGSGSIGLLGHSFGGAVVIEAAARGPARVASVATLATQTAGAQRVGELAPRPLLLVHGLDDARLSPDCSRLLYSMAGEPREIVLLEGATHGLRQRHPGCAPCSSTGSCARWAPALPPRAPRDSGLLGHAAGEEAGHQGGTPRRPRWCARRLPDSSSSRYPKRCRFALAGAARRILVYFTKEAAALAANIERLGAAIEVDGALWIAWPKRASKVPTDMTENVVRDVALPLGLVDNKVAAIDETWSGLRLAWRRELRAALRAARGVT
ncbi:MAG: alpha/beta fold hydrolase [Dehalococcoidia bacterium]